MKIFEDLHLCWKSKKIDSQPKFLPVPAKTAFSHPGRFPKHLAQLFSIRIQHWEGQNAFALNPSYGLLLWGVSSSQVSPFPFSPFLLSLLYHFFYFPSVTYIPHFSISPIFLIFPIFPIHACLGRAVARAPISVFSVLLSLCLSVCHC